MVAELQQKINTKKLKPGLVTFYDTRPGNGASLFILKRKDKQERSKEKLKKKG